MNKSIYLFIGGSLFGVIAALAIVKSTTDTEQTEMVQPQTTTKMKVLTAKMQAENMSDESLSDMQVRLVQQAGNQGMMEAQNEAPTLMPENNENQTMPIPQMAKTQQQKPVVTVPAVPPTTEQVQQYEDMEKIIAAAMNNPKIKLDDLLRQSDSLTIQQRNELTQKTMDMINRGELKIEQFASHQTPVK